MLALLPSFSTTCASDSLIVSNLRATGTAPT
jgi:hypothetical protein